MRKNRGFKRSVRVSRNVHRILSEALTRSISDPRLKGVMLTTVEIADDLKCAVVYWHLTNSTEADRISAAQEAFESASTHFRRLLGIGLKMKSTPRLRFTYDQGIDDSRRIEILLAQAQEGSE